MKAHITIKDLARELNISPSTVSRALKDHPDISPETKRVVKELAERLHYKPNLLAQGLRKSKTNTIGVIVPELVHFFFSTVVSGIEDIAYSRGYNVILCQSAEMYEREVTDARALWDSRVDGMLVSISKQTDRFEHFQELLDEGLPIVFFDRIAKGLDASHVVVDDYQGAFNAVEHLISKGCKKIVHLAGPENLEISKNRLNGYKDCLRKYQIEFDESLVVSCPEGTYEESKRFTNILLNNIRAIDGVFGCNDMAALGAILAVKEKGIMIPDQIKIIGFSDWQLSNLIEPRLSTVYQGGFEMGQSAASVLIDEIESDKEVVTHIQKIISTKLIERDTT
ncbi:MAG: LacI family DNA-binding transcriptional regulator [Cyclobacteriaceae bacterium]|nr:LacI family DNA-binding transcriptional regulator [Cyclobacteriaceae bacterium]